MKSNTKNAYLKTRDHVIAKLFLRIFWYPNFIELKIFTIM